MSSIHRHAFSDGQHLVRIREQRHKLLDEIPRVYYKHQVSKISSA